MRFKQFEIRQLKTKDEYELVKWSEDSSSCYVIAFIKWNAHEVWFDFKSVGTRYLEDREDGLEEFILAYMKVLYVCRRALDE